MATTTTLSTYAYRAREPDGTVVTGTMVAESAEEVGARLRSEGKFVLTVDSNALRAMAQLDAQQVRLNQAARRVRRDDVIAFCQQMSVMLETGVPLAEALQSFCRQIHSREFQLVLNRLREEVMAGESFSVAMSRWPRVFPSMIISLMKAAEVSGQLSMMLGRVGEYLANERRTIKQVKGALSYPMFMIGTSFLMTIFLVAFILPRFARIYASRSASLPAPTQVLMGISRFVTDYWMIYIPVLVAVITVLVIWRTMPSGKRTLDWLRLNFPVVNPMYRKLYVTRSARTMATLLTAGVNVLDIINICRGVTNNYYYDELWNRMEQCIRDGGQMSDAVFESRYVPKNVASMIASGERSGQLDQVMERIAAFSEEELENAIKQVTSFIEPVMIIVMGVVIGGVAMALLLPIFSMGRVVSK